MCDDIQLIGYASSMVRANPSGTAAGYGTTLPLRREITTDILGFDRMVINPLYAQLRRGKAEKLFADAIASVAFTLSRLAGDICLFMSKEFSFITLRDEFTTGSSIMPQKKNPDVFEIIRGRANVLRAVPNTLSMLVTNLSTGYNRDFQVIKEVLFPAIEEVKSLIDMTSYMLPSVVINEKISDNPIYNPIYSAEAANRLVVKGVPFRDAYRIVAKQLDENLFEMTSPADYTHTGSIGNTCTGLIAARAGKLMEPVSRVTHDKLVETIMKI
jgi:argininosuccinate lyase